MRIAFCHHNKLSYGAGGEVLLANLAKYLASRGHKVSIHSLPIIQDKRAIGMMPELPSDIPYHEGVFDRIDADIAYVVFAPLLERFFNFNVEKKIAAIYSHHIAFRDSRDAQTPTKLAVLIHKMLGDSQFEKYDAVHIINRSTKVKHSHLYFIEDPFDENTFKPCAPRLTKFSVLYANRHNKVKGWDIFVALSRRLGQEIDFYYTGKDENLGSAIALGTVGGAKEMAELYSKVHVLISPSRLDTFGNVIVESMMCNTPVITTRMHEFLDLPLFYADTLQQYEEQINSLHINYGDMDVRQYALKYSLRSLGNKYENMFKEVLSG